MGNLLEGLMNKASSTAGLSFQQSYPQIFWNGVKVLKNQQLTPCFKKKPDFSHPKIFNRTQKSL